MWRHLVAAFQKSPPGPELVSMRTRIAKTGLRRKRRDDLYHTTIYTILHSSLLTYNGNQQTIIILCADKRSVKLYLLMKKKETF